MRLKTRPLGVVPYCGRGPMCGAVLGRVLIPKYVSNFVYNSCRFPFRDDSHSGWDIRTHLHFPVGCVKGPVTN